MIRLRKILKTTAAGALLAALSISGAGSALLPAQSIAVEAAGKTVKKKLSLNVGKKSTLKSGLTKFKSSKSTVAVVSKKGVVTALASGKTIITAKKGTTTYEWTLTVKNPNKKSGYKDAGTKRANFVFPSAYSGYAMNLSDLDYESLMAQSGTTASLPEGLDMSKISGSVLICMNMGKTKTTAIDCIEIANTTGAKNLMEFLLWVQKQTAAQAGAAQAGADPTAAAAAAGMDPSALASAAATAGVDPATAAAAAGTAAAATGAAAAGTAAAAAAASPLDAYKKQLADAGLEIKETDQTLVDSDVYGPIMQLDVTFAMQSAQGKADLPVSAYFAVTPKTILVSMVMVTNLQTQSYEKPGKASLADALDVLERVTVY